MECPLLVALYAHFLNIYIVGGKLCYFKIVGWMMYFYACVERCKRHARVREKQNKYATICEISSNCFFFSTAKAIIRRMLI